jgi:hypothetical protein
VLLLRRIVANRSPARIARELGGSLIGYGSASGAACPTK